MWNHGIGPLPSGVKRPFYRILELFELSAVVRYTTEPTLTGWWRNRHHDPLPLGHRRARDVGIVVPLADNFLPAHVGDLLSGEPQQTGEYLLVVLTHPGGGAHHRGGAAEVPEVPGNRNGAGQEVRDLFESAALPRMGVLGRLGDGINRGRNHVVADEVLGGLRGRHPGDDLLDGVADDLPVGRAGMPRAEPWVRLPRRPADGLADPGPLGLAPRGDEHIATLAGENPAGSSCPGILTAFFGFFSPVVGGDGDFGEAVARIG